MTQKRSILNCNNNINCIISPAANVNAAATAATKTEMVIAADIDIADIPIASSRAKSQQLTAKSHSESEESDEFSAYSASHSLKSANTTMP